MMPHICPSISHASGYAREIYLPQTLDRMLDDRVAQPQANRTAALCNSADPVRWHPELLRERQGGCRALRLTRHDGTPVGFAEQQLVSRKAQAVRREIDVQTEARLVIRTSHRDLRQRNAQAAVRAIVRRPEQAALGRRDEVVHEPSLSRQIHPRRLSDGSWTTSSRRP